MIVSASRRTDIPNYYSDWFFNRIKEGFACTRNPVNPRQVSRIDLSPEAVDCIVFWTKNPQPMMARLGELSAYMYYFQFTLTGYGRDIERNIPHKRETMISVFQTLSRQIGSKRIIWRYDPILFTQTYTPQYHLKAFSQIAESLRGYTNKCVVSFVDVYAKNRTILEQLKLCRPEEQALHEFHEFARAVCAIAGTNGMTVETCAEAMDLSQCGIRHGSCIDKAFIEDLLGRELRVGKDRNQRPECGCVQSVDIGAYDTCPNGCLYCYANRGPAYVRKNMDRYDPASPILCGALMPEDVIRERRSGR